MKQKEGEEQELEHQVFFLTIPAYWHPQRRQGHLTSNIKFCIQNEQVAPFQDSVVQDNRVLKVLVLVYLALYTSSLRGGVIVKIRNKRGLSCIKLSQGSLLSLYLC